MDVFLMIRRKKTTIFLDAKETTKIYELKKLLQGITKKAPEDIRLFKEGQNHALEDARQLGDAGYTSAVSKAQAPATLGMVYRGDDGEFEPLEIAPLSIPPDLPEVMKPQADSTATHSQEPPAS